MAVLLPEGLEDGSPTPEGLEAVGQPLGFLETASSSPEGLEAAS